MNIDKIEAVSQTVRALTIDAIEKSNSGHPGLPLGSADIGALLYGEFMNINPKESNWINRDRFILSAGHGSMLLYSLLHLSGHNISLEDIKNFRQIDSKTPGHPEYGHTDGVEATTGPLGAGISNAVGMAIAETHLAEKFNTKDFKIIDHFTYVLAGDGCLMEGISYEAASLAGHLKLGKLIVLFDSNSITIEGKTDITTSEDILKRFESFGWQTLKGNGNNILETEKLISEAKKDKERPTLIELKTTIGYGSPNRAGTSGIHGTPLGKEETIESKKALGIPTDSSFYINPLATELFNERQLYWNIRYNNWLDNFKKWSEANPDKKELWDREFNLELDLESVTSPVFKPGDSISTRKAGGLVLNAFADKIDNIIGGSADLSPSTNTYLNSKGDYSPIKRDGRNINFGIREHAMGGVVNGLSLYGGLIPFASTFLVFSDYMRPTLRLSSLMNIGSIFILTHDSIFVGEDGPTHQPIEHIESLRAIPGLRVLRPADANECFLAYKMAIKERNRPTAIILSRQNLEILEKEENWEKDYNRGAYIVEEAGDSPEVVIAATGSEVNMALEASKLSNKKVRVVSITSRELFLSQPKEFRERIIPKGVKTVVVEAGIRSGWGAIATSYNDIMGIDTFGYSGTAESVAKKLGFTTENLLKKID